VNPESKHRLKLLERRLALFESLTKALTEARPDFIAMDLGAIELRIVEQQDLCGQIASLDAEITRAQSAAFPTTGKSSQTSQEDQQIQAALARVAEAQAEVRRLNDAHQAMLRRSRRTVNALLNLFSSHAVTYGAPTPAVKGTLHEERV
jgi:hypothetical protein